MFLLNIMECSLFVRTLMEWESDFDPPIPIILFCKQYQVFSTFRSNLGFCSSMETLNLSQWLSRLFPSLLEDCLALVPLSWSAGECQAPQNGDAGLWELVCLKSSNHNDISWK